MSQDTVVSEIRHNFHMIYNDKISPMMVKYEEERKSEWKKIYLQETGLIPVAVIFMYLFCKSIWHGNGELGVLLIFIVLVLLGYIFGIPTIKSDNFAKKLKKECLKPLLKSIGKIKPVTNNKEKINPDTNLRESELFSNYNHRYDDDMFEGKYKDVKYTISETRLIYKASKNVSTVFEGVIINFEANKTIKNKTIVATKNDKNIKNKSFFGFTIVIALYIIFAGIFLKNLLFCLFGIAGLLAIFNILFLYYQENKTKETLQGIKLEDTEFNKKYKAYSSDEVEGRYLITTAFMERFKNLQTAFGAKKAKCSFYGDSLMFAIPIKKNLFEIGNLFTPLDSPKLLERFLDEVISILDMIDYFKLNERTGL